MFSSYIIFPVLYDLFMSMSVFVYMCLCVCPSQIPFIHLTDADESCEFCLTGGLTCWPCENDVGLTLVLFLENA
jgi:hypothetical protein